MSFETLTIVLFILAIICLLPISSKFPMIKKVAATVAIAAAFASLGSFIISDQLLTYSSTSLVISALDTKNPDAQGTEIWIKGVEVDGVFYAPENLFQSGGWIKKDGQIGWRSYDQPKNMQQAAIGQIPEGQDRKLFFETNQWRGNAQVVDGKQKIFVDCYRPQTESDVKSIPLSSSVFSTTISANQMQKLVFGGLFVICFLVLILLKEKKNSSLLIDKKATDREVWVDFLKIVSAFAIVVIHATGNLYGTYEQSQRWYMGLYVNSITRFAVPCFMMLSGAFILSKEQTFKEVFTRRIPKVLIPLLFWSVCYILLQYYQNGSDASVVQKIMRIPVNHQNGHLWFIYQLVGFYLLSPILSHMYRSFSKQLMWYFVAVTLLGPSAVDSVFRVLMPNAPVFLEIKWSHIGLAEVGLFMLGRLLLDEMKNRKWAWWWSGIFIFSGFSGIVLGNYFVTVRTGTAYWGFFDQVRFPTVLFAVGIMMLFFKMEKRLAQLPNRTKRIIGQVSGLSLGVYFAHCIPLALYDYNLLVKCVLSFTVSYAFCYFMSQIPYMRRLVA